MSSTDHIDLSLPDNIGTAFIGFLIGSLYVFHHVRLRLRSP